MAKYWVEKRQGTEKLEGGTGIFALRDASHIQFPYVVMSGFSVSALGELFALCCSKRDADTVATALNTIAERVVASDRDK